MDFHNLDILTSDQFSREGMEHIFQLAQGFEKAARGQEQLDLLRGKVLGALFYEPSTRTRFSFERAMIALGGQIITTANIEQSSLKKGETLSDTGRVVSEFVDVIACRHPDAGSVAKLASGSVVPVINAGDGPANHPTQGLLDMYTIQKEKGNIDGLTIGIVGDLKHSRVLHSQCELLVNYDDIRLFLVAPKELRLPEEYKEKLVEKGFEITETDDLPAVADQLDVLSVNRIQHERFASREAAEKHRGCFVVTQDILQRSKENMIILCPLPRREELPKEVDIDPRAKYFEQVGNGIAVRMALLALVLGKVS